MHLLWFNELRRNFWAFGVLWQYHHRSTSSSGTEVTGKLDKIQNFPKKISLLFFVDVLWEVLHQVHVFFFGFVFLLLGWVGFRMSGKPFRSLDWGRIFNQRQRMIGNWLKKITNGFGSETYIHRRLYKYLYEYEFSTRKSCFASTALIAFTTQTFRLFFKKML